MSLSIEEILDAVELPTTSVPLCLKGSLVAEYEALDAQLRDAAPTAASLGEIAPAKIIAGQMAALRELMLAHERTFELVALPAREGSDFRATTPERTEGRPEKQYDDAFHAWVCELLERCCVDPKMTAEQADQLSAKLSNAQWARLTNAAWLVNYNRQDIPFSGVAFALTLNSDAKSKPPEPSESPDHGSLAGSPPSEPSTSGTTPDM